jgi:hypothetical protein
MIVFFSSRRATATMLVLLVSVWAGCGLSSSDKAGGRGAVGRVETLRLHTGGGGPGGYFPIQGKMKAPSGLDAGFAKTTPLADTSGAHAGYVDQLCISGGIKGRADCTVTVTLKKGTVVATGIFTGGGGIYGKLPVVGGSGAYEGARGTYEDSVPGSNPQLVVLHLLLP